MSPEVLPLTSPAGARWLREALEAGRRRIVRAFALPPAALELRRTPPGMPRRSTDSHATGRKGPRA